MARVSYKQGSKSTYMGLSERLSTALYFCTDTRELYRGNDLYTDGLRVVDSYEMLPEFSKAAAGKLYFCSSTRNGYVLNETYNGWTQVLFGVDNDTLEINETGLMQVKSVPAEKVTGLDSRVAELVKVAIEKIDLNVAPATKEKAGVVKPGDDFEVGTDGLLTLKPIAVEKVDGLASRLTNIEQAQAGGVHYKGSVLSVDALPTDAQQGDLYEVKADNSEWCWNGTEWFEYGTKTTDALPPLAKATIDDTQFEIDAQNVLHVKALGAALVNHNGQTLDAILEDLENSLVWTDMDA